VWSELIPRLAGVFPYFVFYRLITSRGIHDCSCASTSLTSFYNERSSKTHVRRIVQEKKKRIIIVKKNADVNYCLLGREKGKKERTGESPVIHSSSLLIARQTFIQGFEPRIRNKTAERRFNKSAAPHSSLMNSS